MEHKVMRNTKLDQFLRSNLRFGASRDVRLAAWLLLALAAGFLAYVARVHEITHDVFHEMSLFREALVLGEFPQDDVFAYTDTVSPSVHHEWATGAVLYWATVGSGFGLAGLAALKFSLIAFLWLMLYRVARMRGAHPYIFVLISFFCFPVFWVGFATVRAQLFTMVAIAVQLWMQEQDWRGRRSWILLWLLMLVAWLNLHAGFVVGLGLITFHSLERMGLTWWNTRSIQQTLAATWHLIAAAPFAAAATFLNPYGWQYIPYLVRAIRMERPLIREWLPLWNTHDPIGTLTMFAIALILFGYAIRRNPWYRAKGAPFLFLAAYMTLKHIRHGSIFGVIWLAYVPAWISRTALGKNLVQWIEDSRSVFLRSAQIVTAASLLFACAHHFWRPSLPPQPLYSSASYPSEVVAFLRDHKFQGNILTPFHVGAYVSWEMYPDVKVSFDGRYEVAYQAHMMEEHQRFYKGEDKWWEILDKYPTDLVLVPQQAQVCERLPKLWSNDSEKGRLSKRHWRKTYEDDAFLLLARNGIDLPILDRTGIPIPDAAKLAFTPEHAHFDRRVERQARVARELAQARVQNSRINP